MNSKKILVNLYAILIIITAFTTVEINATSGKLKSASICTGSDGVTYGNHGDGHWHVAVKHDSGWYPQGSSLGYDNPCTAQIIYEEPVHQEPQIIYEEPAYQEPQIIQEPVNNVPILNINKNEITKYHSELSNKLLVNDLIKLFGVIAIDEEDGDISSNIKTNIESVEINNVTETHKIIFEVSDNNGEMVVQEVILNIKERIEPTIVSNTNLIFDEIPDCKKIIENNSFEVKDMDEALISLTCNNIQIDEVEKKIHINVTDKFNMRLREEFSYELNEKNGNIMPILLIVLIGGISYFFAKKVGFNKKT